MGWIGGAIAVVAILAYFGLGGEPPPRLSGPTPAPSTSGSPSPDPVLVAPARAAFQLVKASWDLSVPAEGETRKLQALSPLEGAKATRWENLDIGVSQRR